MEVEWAGYRTSNTFKLAVIIKKISAYFCLVTPRLQVSILIVEVANISSDPGLFPATFHPNYLTSCVSHYCNIGGNVDAITPQTEYWCKFLTYCCLKSKCHIWVPQILKIKLSLGWISFVFFFRRTWKFQHHQIIATSSACPRKAPCYMGANS